MGYLLDTHVFIRLMEGGKKLSPKAKTILQNSKEDLFVSVASVWEIIIKQSKGKLKTPEDIEGGIREAGFKTLSIEISHVLGVRNLASYHKDPFDRILISQARVENLTLVTSDEKIFRYKISAMRA